MDDVTIFERPKLATVSYRADLAAVYLKWHDEYDEGTGVRDAVPTAIEFVREHSVENWLADISESVRTLSDADMEFVNGAAFVEMIRNSTLRKFALVPPLPETGQDTDWLVDWEKETLAKFGDRVQARVLEDRDAIAAFFAK